MVACAVADGLILLEFADRPGLKEKFKQLSQMLCTELREGKHIFLTKTEQELKGYFAGENQVFTVPLHKLGTSFEEKVWVALTKIPYGETRTYAQVASIIGNPAATRAVGRANGRNPFAIIVPCHRLIGTDGKMHGYGGGVWRKEWLLDFEKK